MAPPAELIARRSHARAYDGDDVLWLQVPQTSAIKPAGPGRLSPPTLATSLYRIRLRSMPTRLLPRARAPRPGPRTRPPRPRGWRSQWLPLHRFRLVVLDAARG